MKTISEMTIMNAKANIKTYICMFLMIMGICVNAWGAGITFNKASLSSSVVLSGEDMEGTIGVINITGSDLHQWGTPYWTIENYGEGGDDTWVFYLDVTTESYGTTSFNRDVTITYYTMTTGTLTADLVVYYTLDGTNYLTKTLPITLNVTAGGGSGHNITYHVPDCASNKPSNENNVAAGSHSLPTNVNVDGYTFAGWTENGSYTDGTSAPTTLYTSSFMMPGDRDVELYAVYSQSQSVSASSISWSAYSGSPVADGNYVISNGQYAQNGTNTMLDNQMADRGTRIAAKSVTMTGGKITSEITSVAWQIKKSGEYWTIYNPYANKYVAATANDNEATLVSSVSGNAALWKIEKTSNTYNIISKLHEEAGETAKYLKYNSTTNAWACYSGSSAIYLFVTDVNPFASGTTTYTLDPKCTTYTVTYDGNGKTSGSVPTDATKYTQGATAIVLGNVNGLAKTGSVFAGWATSSSATVAEYHSGSELTIGTSNVTLYAVWNTAEYSISYYDQDGASYSGSNEALLPKTHTYGTATDLVVGVKSGSTFDGWYTNPECTGAAVTSLGATAITDDVTLYAKWSERYTNFAVSCANETQITVWANNGTEPEEFAACTVEEGSNDPICYTPTKTGYEIVGYYTGRTTGGTKVYEGNGTMVLSNGSYTDESGWISTKTTLDLYAVWQAITYTVHFDRNTGTSGTMSDQSHTYDGSKALLTNQFGKQGYDFAGWSRTAEGAVEFSDKQVVTNLSLTKDDVVNLYAKWTPKTISIIWDANGGTVDGNGTKVTPYTYDGESVALPTPDERTGYTFKGWWTTASGGSQITEVGGTNKPTSDKTYYAHWTVNDYTAKLDKNTSDGSGTDGSIKVTYDSRTVKAITHATRTGYTLTGYYSAASSGTLIVNADGTLSDKSHSAWLSSTEPHNWIHADNEGVLYARWSVNTYAVTLKANDGVTADRTSQFTYGAKTVSTFTGFTRTGYTLDGYYTAEAGGVMVLDANKKLVADVPGYTDAEGNWVRDTDPTITLWAHWTINTYNLNYYNVEGATNSNPATYNVTTPTFTLVDPVKTGHAFGGWYTAAGLGTLANTTIEQGSTGDKSFYAKWSVNDYSATLNANYTDGVDGSITVTYGTRTRKAYTGVTRDGWRLEGYYTTTSGGTMIVDAEGNLCDIKLAQWLDESHNWIRTDNIGVLYAHWTKTDYTITCQTKTGSAIGCSTVEAVAAGTENVVITLNESCIPDGYHLLEWECSLSSGFTTDVANRQITITTMPTKDVTVTAVLAPDLTVTGTVQLTSGQNIAVYAPAGTITISSTNMSIIESVRIKYYDKNDGDREYTGDARSTSEFRLQTDGYTVGDGGSGNISVSTVYGSENSKTFSMVYNPNAAGELDHYQMKVELLVGQKVYDTKYLDVYGRSLPETFAIVMKNEGDKNWYALPNDLDASTSAAASTKAPVVVMVDNQTTPTKVTFGPSNALYKADGRYEPMNHRGAIRFLKGDVASNAWITTSSSSQLFIPAYGADKQQFNLTSSNFSDYLITQDGADGRISMYGGTIGWYNSGSNTKVYLLPVEAQLLPKEADIIEWGANGLVVEVDATNVAGMIATVGGESTSQLTMNQTMTSAGSATKYDYTFNLGALSLIDKADQVMLLQWKNSSDVVIGTTMVKVPRIINSNVVASEDAATKTAWTNYDKIVVLPGAKLTVDGATSGFLNPTLKCVEVYPGGKLNIASGTVQTNTLILRAGWSSNKQWAMPNVAIDASATLTNTNAYLDWYVDYHHFYPIAVPFPVTVANMKYVNTNSSAASGVTFKQYDGLQRATEGQISVGRNWKEIKPTTLTPSTGYAMTARRPSGKAWSIVRMPLTFTNEWTTNGEQAAVNTETKNVVNVTAYGVGGEQPWYCQGWNFVANPFMVPYNSSDEGLTGKLSFQNGGTVKYATIPDINFEGYDQLPIASANLQPMSGFFVQVATSGDIAFAVAGKQSMAAPILAARAEEDTKGLSAEGYIKVSGNGQTDMFGLLVGDEYTAGNDLGSDLQKIIGDTKLRAYMIYNEEKMAYVAVNEALAKEWIPVTVNIPASGSYQFTLDENVSEIDELEGLYLMDNLMGTTTNLLYQAYEFEAEAGTLAGRFALNAIRKIADAPTDIEGVDAMDGIKPRKIIYDDKLFILVGGKVYDGTGKLMNK